MEFEISFLPIILGILIVYGIVGIGLIKNDIKGVYRRRTRKEKFLSGGVAVLSMAIMLLFASRQEGAPETLGWLTNSVNAVILWAFHQDIQIMTLAVYLMLCIPVMILGAASMEAIAQKYKWMELPFHFYLLLFVIDLLFYHPIRVAIGGWLCILVIITFLFCLIETIEQGKTKKKLIFLALLVISLVAICILDQGIAGVLILRFVLLMAENIFAAFLINRAGVLRSGLWKLVTLLIYAGLFALHFCTIF